MRLKYKPRKQKKENLRASAMRGYARNMKILQDWKSSHPCEDCGRKYPHYAMQFDVPTDPTQLSVAVLASTRCTVAKLQEAMENTDLLCSNCRCIRHGRVM